MATKRHARLCPAPCCTGCHAADQPADRPQSPACAFFHEAALAFPQKPAYRPPSGRDVAQPGSASHWGCGGRRFESSRPDQIFRIFAIGSAGDESCPFCCLLHHKQTVSCLVRLSAYSNAPHPRVQRQQGCFRAPVRLTAACRVSQSCGRRWHLLTTCLDNQQPRMIFSQNACRFAPRPKNRRPWSRQG